MPVKIKQLIYLILWIAGTSSLTAQSPSPLSSSLWQESLKQSPELGEIGEALTGLAQRDPLFFSDLAPRILAEGFKNHSTNFAEANPEFFRFLLQEFETVREIGFRVPLLAFGKFMSNDLQQEFSNVELNFLLSVSPQESHLRMREIKAWITLTQPLLGARLSFLMLYNKTKDSAVRYFLLRAIQTKS